MPDEDVPSEVLLDSTLGSAQLDELDELGGELEQVDRRRLRNLVHQRVFGESPETLRIGRYVLLERLGSGGMGVVFSAYDQELDRKVAIKLLHEGKGPEHHARLLREAQALARLSHPNVIQVHDVGEAGGQVFVAMEFVAGKTLRQWSRERPRSIRETIAIYLQAGRGLEAAHRAGIVHRDFKPDNVLIGDDGRVRVLDFGIARAERGEPLAAERPAPDTDPSLPLTRTGMLVGTPAYMAPEQHRGEPADMRSDQFAFCVALHESLHRTRPFAGETYSELVDNVIAGRRRPLEGSTTTPRWLRELLARGLSADPDQRFPDMSALLRELSRDRVVVRARLAIGAMTLAVAGVVAYSVAELERAHERDAASMTSEIQSEGRRADDAERELRRREDAVTIAEASLLLPESPARALARLRELHDEHTLAGAARIIASDARQRGFPNSLHRWPEQLSVMRVSDDGRRALLVDGKSHELHVLDVLSADTKATKLVVGDGVVTISGDGRFVAVRAIDDGQAFDVWDVEAGSSTRIAAPLEGWIDALYASPSGDRFVVCSSEADSPGWLLDRDGGRRALPDGMCGATFVAGSDDLLLTDDLGVLRRFNPESGALTTILREVGWMVKVSPNGRYVAAATRHWNDHRLLVATLDGAREIASFQFEDSTISAFTWHPDSNALAIGGSEGGAFVVGLDGRRRVELPMHHRQVRSLTFSADGELLASASQAGSVFVTRLANGHAEALPGHRSMGWAVFDAQGKLRSIERDGTLRVWDPMPRRLVRTGLGGAVSAMAWSSQGLLALANFRSLAVVPAGEGEPLWSTDSYAPYHGVAWSEAGDRLASVNQDGTLRVWSGQGELLQTVPCEGGTGGDVRWLGDWIAWGEGGVGVHLLESGTDERELIPLPNAAEIVAIEPDPTRDRLWVGIRNSAMLGSVIAFDEQSKARLAEHQLGRDGLMDVAMLPDRNALAYGTMFGDLFVLELETGERRRLGAHDDGVRDVEVDALGRTLYTASQDGSARIWDLTSGRWRELRADDERIWSLALAPDGTALATGQNYGDVTIWRDDLPHDWDELRDWIDEVSPAAPR